MVLYVQSFWFFHIFNKLYFNVQYCLSVLYTVGVSCYCCCYSDKCFPQGDHLQHTGKLPVPDMEGFLRQEDTMGKICKIPILSWEINLMIRNFHFLGLIRTVGKTEEVQWINNLNKFLSTVGNHDKKRRILQIIAGKNNERWGRSLIYDLSF